MKSIAVIGMSGRFPDAKNLDEFWQNLVSEKESIKDLPPGRIKELQGMLGDLGETQYIKYGYVDQITHFEPELFALNYEESKYIDPQQRWLLELVEEALLDAGYNPEFLSGQRIGTFIAETPNTYTDAFGTISPMAFMNLPTAASSGRVAYTYNFTGPAVTLTTACSSALTAIHYGCQSLNNGDCELVVVGGVNLRSFPTTLEEAELLPVLSDHMQVRSFDAKADGTVGGEGGGVLILKSLEQAIQDHDPIHAVIRSTAVNSDGNRSNGMSSPSEDGQADVIMEAIEKAEIEPKSISYIETHGTGTKIGDPIEISGLSRALNKLGYPKQSVPIGSLKTNIGHLDGAAGVASAVKTILALKHQKIPASLNFEVPNPMIKFEDAPIYVNDRLSNWEVKGETLRRAGVTSLGLTGTNVHIIFEEYPAAQDQRKGQGEERTELIQLSARTETSLTGMAQKLHTYLVKHPDVPLADIAYTLHTGRRDFRLKWVSTATSTPELIANLEAFLDGKAPAFKQPKKQDHRFAYVIPDFYDAKYQELERLYQDLPLFKEYSDQFTAEVKDESPRFQYAAYMFAYAKVMEAYSQQPEAIIGFGVGNIIANYLSEELTLAECIEAIQGYDRDQLVIPEDKLGMFIDRVAESGVTDFVLFGAKEGLAETFTRVFSGQGERSLVLVNEDPVAFYQTVTQLLKAGIRIDWREIYQQTECQRLNLPGYVFDQQSFYLTKEVTKSSGVATFSFEKEVTPAARQLLHQINWQEEPLVSELKLLAPGTWVIFHDSLGIGEQLIPELSEQVGALVQVDQGNQYEAIDPFHYTIRVDQEEDYRQLLAEISSQHGIPQGVVNLFNCGRPDETDPLNLYETIDQKLNLHLYSGFYLNKALIERCGESELTIYNVLTNSQQVTERDALIHPVQRMNWVMNKVLNQELPNVQLFNLDFDLSIDSVAEIGQAILAEITGNQHQFEVSYRQQKRYIQYLSSAPIRDEDFTYLPLKEEGVYLVTGGTGGIALELCKYIASQAKVQFLLLDRLPFAEVAAGKKQIIAELEAQGSRVAYFQGNIADYSQMQAVITEIKRSYPRIHGLLHTAGISGDLLPYAQAGKDEFEKLFQTKVYGTLILEKLLRAEFLDFFAMCSSQSTDVGGYGYGEYATANSFLDAFSMVQRKYGKKFITIKWAGWAQVGMGAQVDQSQLASNSGLIPLKNVDGVTAFDAILKYNLDNLWVCHLNEKIKAAYESFGFFKIQELAEQVEPELKIDYTSVPETLYTMLRGLYTGDEFELTDKITELNLDSIDMMQFVGKVKKAFNLQLPMTIFFEEITVGELFATIEGSLKQDGEENRIPQQPEQEYYPVSSAQKRLFVIDHIDNDNTAHNISGTLLIEGKLDLERFNAAFRKLIQRHEAFRTSFELINHQPVQRIHPTVEFAVDYLEGDESELAQIAKDYFKPFDLAVAPLLRIGLVRVTDEKHLFIFEMHHSISDGVSMSIFMKEFIDLYHGKELPELRIQYKDFAVWQNQLFASEEIKEQEKFWVERFAGTLPILDLPTDYPRPSMMDFAGGEVHFHLDPEQTTGLKALANQQGATLYMIILAAYNVLLAKYSRQEDIIIGSPTVGRSHSDLEEMIGMFVNTLPMRNYPEQGKTFAQFLEEVKQSTLQAFDNQDYQFEMLVEQLNLQRDVSRNPLFDTMFVLQNNKMPELEVSGLTFSPYPFEKKMTNFDLTLEASEYQGELHLRFDYRTRLFKSKTMERMSQHLLQIFAQILQEPTRQIADLELITGAEKELIAGFNQTAVEYPKERVITQIIEEQVATAPEQVAIVYQDQQLTYGQLNEQANRLARALGQRGVTREEIVGIMVDPSVELFVGVLGILKAGAAYLPIDPAYPKERIQYMLADSQAKLLVSQQQLAAELNLDVEVLLLEDQTLESYDPANLEPITQPQDLAYIIYTSGSTGEPKGVMIEHHSLHNLCNWHRQKFALTAQDRTTKYAGFGFDASVWEIFPSLAVGAEIHVIDPETKMDLHQLNDYFETHGITVSFLPTQLCEQFMKLKNKSLRVLLTGGDKLNTFVRRNYALYNNYGPSENTVVASCYQVEGMLPNIPIGQPISNTQIHILDAKNQLQPIGVPGELCLTGESLARGYLNRPELTAEKFVPSPFNPTEKMYRTGDLARWLPDGNIEFLGRIDTQVQIRGFRIELGEIEGQILEYAGVRETVVLALEEQSDKYLVAYLVIEQGQTIQTEELTTHLATKLPEYMIPTYFVMLDAIPLTANGKVDRRGLPAPQLDERKNLYVQPRTEDEEQLATIWANILGRDQVGVMDNFFELGGDSIKAIQILAEANQTGLHLTVKDIFKYKTIANLLSNINLHKGQVVASQEEVTGGVLLTPIQQEFFAQNLSHPNYYYQTNFFQLPAEVDLERLEASFTRLIQHHDALRMSYQIVNGQVKQFNRAMGEIDFQLQVMDLSEKSDQEQQEALVTTSRQVQESLNLERDLLIQAVVYDLGRHGKRLLIPIHHLVVDGVSWRILLEDLEKLYSSNLEVELPLKTTSFKEWSQQLTDYAETELLDVEYWKRLDPTQIDSISVPEEQVGLFKDYANLTFELEQAETASLLTETSWSYNTEINDILLAAFTLALTEVMGMENILINLEGHGREEIIESVDLSRTIGWFTTTYPVYFRKQANLDQMIKHVKENLRRIPNKGLNYGVVKYLTPDSKLPELKPEISFNYLGQFTSADENQTETHLLLKASEEIALSNHLENQQKYLLDLNGLVQDGRFKMNIIYNTQLLEKWQVLELRDQYRGKLLELVEYCSQKAERVYSPADFGMQNYVDEKEFDQLTELVEVESVEIYPLTPMQEGMLFHYTMNEEGQNYFEQLAFYINGQVDPDQLQTAWDQVLRRYDIFKTSFSWRQTKNPLQLVNPDATIQIHQVDLTDYAPAQQEELIQKYKSDDFEQGFDFAEGDLNRLSILQLSAERSCLVWTYHHILLDGWSVSIILGEFLQTYYELLQGQELTLTPAAIQFGDYLSWFKDQNKNQGYQFWRNYIRDFTEPTPLPYDHKRVKDEVITRATKTELVFDQAKTALLNEFCKKHNITMNALVQTAWGLLLQKYNSAETSCFGMTVSGRPVQVKNIEQAVGIFINTLPVLIKTLDGDTLRDLITRVNTELVEMKDYEYISLAEIQKMTNHSDELFDSLIIFENYPVDAALLDQELGFSVELDSMFELTNYDFSIVVVSNDQLKLEFTYNQDLFNPETVERIQNLYVQIMETILTDVDQPVSQLSMVSAAEAERILYELNQNTATYPENQVIHQLFEEQVALTPDRIAVTFEEEELTYAELNQKANQLARILREKGVGRDQIVGIYVERSLDVIIGFMAIMKAGGAYLPIDPIYPEDRIQYMLQDSGTQILLTQHQLREKIDFAGEIIELDASELYTGDGTNLELINRPEDLIYIIYTSGSTGNPKGVMLEHRNVVRLFKNSEFQFEFGQEDVWTMFHSFCFDFSVWEMYGALLFGGKVIIVSRQAAQSTEDYLTLLKEQQVTVLNQTPTAFYNLIAEELKSDQHDLALRYVIFGGEALQPAMLKPWKELYPDTQLINMYGITETTVHVTYKEITEGEMETNISNIGQPIPTLTSYIMDENLTLLPIGVAGEICVGGAGVARGYLNRPELTAEKFTQNPYKPEERLYRSGDLARLLPNGELEYLGRIDNQVKIRGFRIELGEIENRLLQHPAIEKVVVMDRVDRNGDKYLCAYYIAETGLTVAELREFLAAGLPDYMIPAYFMPVEEFLLTSNGKVNRNALPEPDGSINTGVDYVAPRNEIEEKLIAIWNELLEIKEIGIDDKFFEIGGNSLKILRMTSMINNEFGSELKVTQLFKHSSIREIASLLTEGVVAETEVAAAEEEVDESLVFSFD